MPHGPKTIDFSSPNGNGSARTITIVEITVFGLVGIAPKDFTRIGGKTDHALRLAMLFLVRTIHQKDSSTGNRDT